MVDPVARPMGSPSGSLAMALSGTAVVCPWGALKSVWLITGALSVTLIVTVVVGFPKLSAPRVNEIVSL